MSSASPTERHEQMFAPVSPTTCPLCGGPSIPSFCAEDRNRRVSAERFRYHRCQVCSTVFLVNVPEDLARYYAGDYHQFDASGEPLWRRHDGLLTAEDWRVNVLRAMVNPSRLIDVGAGAGGFVAAAQEGGFNVTALEMDTSCCQYIRDHLGAQAICTDRPIAALRSLPPARVVTLWHVLEHLREPGEMLAAAAQSLEPGGVLALAGPNPDSLQFRLLRGRWAHLDAPRHVCLLPASAIVLHARELGLELLWRTTSDPSGLECNRHGWVYALRRDPSDGPARGVSLRLGTAITGAFGPLERRGVGGAALTLFLRKPNS
jgi:2-polyprenyl-3-methyl-5-hydroxy-6-metoxy-1,4-benzoquinol methylase